MLPACLTHGLQSPSHCRTAGHVRQSRSRCRALPHDHLNPTPQIARRSAVLGIAGVATGGTVLHGSAEAGQIGEGVLRQGAAVFDCNTPDSGTKGKLVPGTCEAYRKATAVKRVVKLFLQEDFSKLEEITSPEAFLYFQSPSALPYAGKYIGQDCVRQFMGRLNESFIITSTPEAYQYVNESGSVFAAFDFVLKPVASGKEFQTSMTMKIKVNDDLKLEKIAIISDTLAQYNALH